jgi:methyl-accepting chemotaxis protein
MEIGRAFEFNRRLLIDREVQISLLVYTCSMMLLSVLFTVLLLRISGQLSIGPTGQTLSGVEADLLNTAYARPLIYLALAFVIITAVFANLELSNRLVGPIYRLRRHMTDVASGKRFEDVKFRDHDEFLDLADKYNQVLKRLKDAEDRLSQ